MLDRRIIRLQIYKMQRWYERTLDSGLTMFSDLIEAIEKYDLPQSLNEALSYAENPEVVKLVIGFLIVMIFFLTWYIRSLRKSNTQLHSQLQYERTEGRRKAIARAEAKRETEGDARFRGLKGKKKNLTNVPPDLASVRIAKMMSAGKTKTVTSKSEEWPEDISAIVGQGNLSVKERVAHREKKLRDASQHRDKSEGILNERCDNSGDDDKDRREVAGEGGNDGSFFSMIPKAQAHRRRPRARQSDVIQNMEVDAEGSSDDQEVVLRQSMSFENRNMSSSPEPVPPEQPSSEHALKDIPETRPEPKERQSRSSLREITVSPQAFAKWLEAMNEPVLDEIGAFPQSNITESTPKPNMKQSQSDNIRTSSPAKSSFKSSERKNLSAKKNITKTIPKITVEECSDDNVSISDIVVDEDDLPELESASENSGSGDDSAVPDASTNDSFDATDASTNISVNEEKGNTPKERFANILSKFRESESDGASSDDQSVVPVVSAKVRFNSALARFKKDKKF